MTNIQQISCGVPLTLTAPVKVSPVGAANSPPTVKPDISGSTPPHRATRQTYSSSSPSSSFDPTAPGLQSPYRPVDVGVPHTFLPRHGRRTFGSSYKMEIHINLNVLPDDSDRQLAASVSTNLAFIRIPACARCFLFSKSPVRW